MARYAIEENGRSGSVDVHDDRIVRTHTAADGSDKVETIPMEAVGMVERDGTARATDDVTLRVGLTAYRWKVKRADALVEELHRIQFVTATLNSHGRHRW